MVDGFITEYANINRGVPQGTVIGPFLFPLMVEDIKPKEPEINKLIKFALIHLHTLTHDYSIAFFVRY